MWKRNGRASARPVILRRRIARFAALLTGVAVCATFAAEIILAHMPTIMNIFKETPLLKEQKWNYEKHDLPSARVSHPVLLPEAWWARPKHEWAEMLASWSKEKRKAFPGGVSDMEAAHEKMTRKAHASVAYIMKISEKDLVRYVPPQSPVGRRKNYCPACGKGKLVWAGSSDWDRVKCSACSMAFPNDEYPAERKHALGDPLGQPVIFKYYRDKKGFNHFFEALTYGPRRDKMMEFGLKLARAYHVTRDAAYARRAALLLDQLATAFPHWCMRNGADPHIYVLGEGWHSGTGQFDRWSGRWMFGVPYECVSSYEPIYDMIYESDELDTLSEERKYDVRRHIERDLFYENITVFISAEPFIGPVGDLEHVSAIGIIRRGRVLNDAGLMHRGFAWAEKRSGGLLRDGTYGARPGDAEKIRSSLTKVTQALAGWTDPPGTTGNKHRSWNHELFIKFDAAERLPVLTEMNRFAERIAMPNGLASPVQGIEVRRVVKPRDGRSAILPAWGHATLGAGQGRLAIQSQMHFGGDYGDGYRDGLGMMLYAFGREMLSDVGAEESKSAPNAGGEATKIRRHSLSHNTVVIDRLSQVAQDPRAPGLRATGNLLAYAATLRGLSAVEASAERRYPGAARKAPKADVYRRIQILVTTDPRRPYVVDIFRVAGGSIHDYVIHGSCAGPMTAETTVPLTQDATSLMKGDTPRTPNPEPEELKSSAEAYGRLKDVRSGNTTEGWRATFRFDDQPSLGVRLHGLGGAPTELFLARSPYTRRGGGANERPCLIARRRDSRAGTREGDADSFESLFVTVIEPFGNGPLIDSVERIAVEPSDRQKGALALRIRWNDGGGAGGRTDTLLVCAEGLGLVRAEGGIEFDGRIGLVSETGATSTAYMLGGTLLKKGDLALEAQTGVFKGTIEAMLRTADGNASNAFVTRKALPVGAALEGSFVILTMPKRFAENRNAPEEPLTLGFRIDRIERDGERTVIHTDGDHGLRMLKNGVASMTYVPRHRFLGVIKFTIRNAVSSRDPDLAP